MGMPRGVPDGIIQIIYCVKKLKYQKHKKFVEDFYELVLGT